MTMGLNRLRLVNHAAIDSPALFPKDLISPVPNCADQRPVAAFAFAGVPQLP